MKVSKTGWVWHFCGCEKLGKTNYKNKIKISKNGQATKVHLCKFLGNMGLVWAYLAIRQGGV